MKKTQCCLWKIALLNLTIKELYEAAMYRRQYKLKTLGKNNHPV